MIFRKASLPLCLVLGLISLVACNRLDRGSSGTLDERLQVLHRHDKGGRPLVSARVVDVSTGEELYAENADVPVLPASNMKVLVTAAALDFFGPDHAFKTYLAAHENNLWIIGTGDPGTGDQPIAARRGGDTLTIFDEWVDAIRRKPLGTLSGTQGNLIIDKLYYYDGALDEQRVHPSWAKDDLVNWYAAPISGLNFNDNCVDITIYPTEPGQPVRYEVVPPTAIIKVVNTCTTGDKNSAEIERAQGENTYTISGTCSERTVLRSKPVTDAGAFFADAFRTHLKSHGIEVKSVERAARPPFGRIDPPEHITIAFHATTVRELLPRINKPSQNLLTEGLCKLLGRAYDQRRFRPGPGSWSSGGDAIHEFLQRLGIDHGGIVIADGSGLSRDNRVTTRAVSDLLVKMRSHPHGEVFFESLSVGGVDGTIRNRFTDVPGLVHAKTGYIGGVRSLSGYVPSKRGKPIVFSFIYNRIPGPVKPYEELQDHAVRTLMSWPELDYVAPASTQPTTESASRPTTRPAQPATSVAGD